MERFVWQPGADVDPKALERLREIFRRPSSPMGEAWFMGHERRMFPELMGDLSSLDAEYFKKTLEEITTGTSCFGPLEEWRDWYHYLLPRLIPRSHEGNCLGSLLDYLITPFFCLYPNGVNKPPYKGFVDDVLNTLGRCMMEPENWDGDNVVLERILYRSNDNPAKVWGWWGASGDFSASMFLCLKYLPPDLVQGWFESVLAIPSPHWRAQVIVWLVGARELLLGNVGWLSELEAAGGVSVGWDWSHSVQPGLASSDISGAPAVEHFLPRQSREAVLDVAYKYFTEDTCLEWLEAISTVPYLEAELAAIPGGFETMYVERDAD